MFISKLLVIVLSVELIMQVEAHISIQIDPEDMDRVSDFFESIIFNRQQLFQPTVHSRFGIIRLTKKFLSGGIQMLSIMITLVSANLLTTKLSQPVLVNSEQREPVNSLEVIDKNLTSSTVEMCNSNDFGCNRGICWRTCTVQKAGDQGYLSWCFTAPEKMQQKFHHCKNNMDCSGCWECSFPCVRKVCLFVIFIFRKSSMSSRILNFISFFLPVMM